MPETEERKEALEGPDNPTSQSSGASLLRVRAQQIRWGGCRLNLTHRQVLSDMLSCFKEMELVANINIGDSSPNNLDV